MLGICLSIMLEVQPQSMVLFLRVSSHFQSSSCETTSCFSNPFIVHASLSQQRSCTRQLLFPGVPQIPAVPRTSPCYTMASAMTCLNTGSVGRGRRPWATDSTWARMDEVTVTVMTAGSATMAAVIRSSPRPSVLARAKYSPSTNRKKNK